MYKLEPYQGSFCDFNKYQLEASNGDFASCDSLKVIYRLLRVYVKEGSSAYIFNRKTGKVIFRVDKEICKECILESCDGCTGQVC